MRRTLALRVAALRQRHRAGPIAAGLLQAVAQSGIPCSFTHPGPSDDYLASRTVLPQDRAEDWRAFLKVLIVDDSAIIRVRLAELLTEVEGIEIVAQADNANEAADLVRELEPDVAIVDLRMPQRSGMDLIEEVKKNPQPPKIIMLTNFPTPENREKCLSYGADYFFDKSSEIEEVMAVLKNLLQESGSQHP